jgi:hypothetical protein
MTERLYTVEAGSSARAVDGLLRVLCPDAATILDATYGSGAFWTGQQDRQVIGMDVEPSRARDVVGDFTALPFRTGAVDLVVFDPPYHTDMGRATPSRMGTRFGTFATLDELQHAFAAGCREAWRVARIGVLVKCQDYIHASRFVEMTHWARTAIGQAPYQRLDLKRSHKLLDRKWGDQLSLYSNSATFLVFRHGDQRHIRRRPAALEVAS